MDYSISYHPISKEQMQEWYFDVFEDLGAANELTLRIPKEQQKDHTLEALEEHYNAKYVEMIKRSRDLDYTSFNKWHAYFIAIIQGFFEKFYFVQGTAISAILDEEFHTKYVTPWEDVVPSEYTEDLHVSSKLEGEFSGGAYMSPEQVKLLLNDYEHDAHIKELLENQFSGQKIVVFVAALKYASENNQGLVEAARIIEQSEQVFEEPSCYSNLFNCDVISAAVYTTELAAHYDAIYKGLGDDR